MLNRVCIRRQHYQCCCLCIQVTFLCLGLLYASFARLLSGSGDGTALVWAFNDTGTRLQHQLLSTLSLSPPSFVYSARFVPRTPDVIVTGSFDRAIRLWSSVQAAGAVLGTLGLASRSHESHVNCIEFSDTGDYMFSADGVGEILVWETGGRLDRHYSYKVTGAPGVMGCRRLPILRLRACVDFTSLIRRHLLLVCASLQVVWALKDPTLRGVPIVALSYRPLLNQIAVLAHNVRLRGSSTSTVLTVPHLPWSAWQQPWCNRL